MLQSQYLDSEFKKKGGVFYTPQYLANYVAQRMLSFADIKNNGADFSVLDPACGDGMLLNSLLNKSELSALWYKSVFSIRHNL